MATGPGFDYQVEHYNKEGKVVHRNPYRMTVSAAEGTKIERPPYSGKWFNPDGTVLKDESAAIEAQKEAKLRADAEVVAVQLAEAKAKDRAQLKMELLAEIEAEKKVKASHGNGTQK